MCDLYPEIVHEADLTPSIGQEFDSVCEKIHAACKGFGTNEIGLIKALASQTPAARCKVAVRYKEIHGQELKEVLASECGKNDFGTALQFLAVPPNETDCDIIQKACKGMGTDELLLYPIVVGRSNRDVEVLKKTFFKLYTEDLGRYLDKELGGDFEDLVFNCLQASEQEFDPKCHTDEKAKEDAEALFKLGQGKWGTDEKGLFKMLCSLPPQHMKNVNAVYSNKYGYTLVKAIQKELNGKVEDAAVHLVEMKIKPAEAVAKLIDKACQGFGTNELLLAATLIRYQPILKNVMVAHEELYGKNLIQRLMDETTGDYQRLLVQVCQTAQDSVEDSDGRTIMV